MGSGLVLYCCGSRGRGEVAPRGGKGSLKVCASRVSWIAMKLSE